MNLKSIHNVYFIGIGGIGMSALARYFMFIDKNVAGYDKTETPLTQDLVKLGIDIHYEDNHNVISTEFHNPDTTLVVYTPAVPHTHTEYQYFLGKGFDVKKRSEVLGMITVLFCRSWNTWKNNYLKYSGALAERNRYTSNGFLRWYFRRF